MPEQYTSDSHQAARCGLLQEVTQTSGTRVATVDGGIDLDTQ